MYPKKITKDEIELLPLQAYTGLVKLVDDAKDVALAMEDILKEPFIGIDTETKPSFKKGVSHKTCLIQVATAKMVYIFRLHYCGFVPELRDLLENPKVLKVGIAFIQDLKELKADYGTFSPKAVLDLNIKAKEFHIENIGAKNLAALFLAIRISKKQRTSNWEAVELNEAQITYAATDAWVCWAVYQEWIKLNLVNL